MFYAERKNEAIKARVTYEIGREKDEMIKTRTLFQDERRRKRVYNNSGASGD